MNECNRIASRRLHFVGTEAATQPHQTVHELEDEQIISHNIAAKKWTFFCGKQPSTELVRLQRLRPIRQCGTNAFLLLHFDQFTARTSINAYIIDKHNCANAIVIIWSWLQC